MDVVDRRYLTRARLLPVPPDVFVATKRSVLAVSQALGDLALRVAPHDDVVVVVAFQHVLFLRRSASRYARIASACDLVVATAGNRLDDDIAVPGMHVVSVPPDGSLAREWSLVVLSRSVSAALVAIDMNRTGVGRSSDDARLFRTEIGLDPRWAAAHAVRITEAAGDALGTRALDGVRAAAARSQAIDDRHVVTSSRPDLQAAWTAIVRRTEALQRTERLALQDPLTGAFNRRMLERWTTPDAIASAVGAIMSVVGFDLDDFKGVNDTYGHAIGDAVLRVFADTVRSATRKGDLLVRTGGDEFLLLLPGATIETAVTVATVVLDRFADAQLEGAPALRPQASAGVGSFRPDAVDLEAIDRAMYEAKRSGRVVSAPVAAV